MYLSPARRLAKLPLCKWPVPEIEFEIKKRQIKVNEAMEDLTRAQEALKQALGGKSCRYCDRTIIQRDDGAWRDLVGLDRCDEYSGSHAP